MATIKEVAQAAQVSATTVSRVLNKDDSISVSAEVRMRIFQAAHTLGYVSPRQRRLSDVYKRQEALRILDENTLKYYVEELEEKLRKVTEEKDAELQKVAKEKDTELQKITEEKDAEIAELKKLLKEQAERN